MEDESVMEVLMEGAAAETETYSESHDIDFMSDEQASSLSALEVTDRLTFLEQRLQMQEDEIQLLKMNMIDVLKRLNISEQQNICTSRAAPAKARPASLVLPVKSSSSSSSSLRKSSSSTLPSSPSCRNYSPAPASRQRAPPAGSKVTSSGGPRSSVSKKTPETRQKESGATGSSSRVTQCKVTLQIFLRSLSRRSGSIDLQLDGSPALIQRPRGPHVPLHCHKSPAKAPGQYFQICC